MYGEPVRPSGGPSGSTCHHDCPAAASQSTNAIGMLVQYPVRQRGRMKQDSGCAFEEHAFRTSRRLRISHGAPSQEPTTAHPDPGGRADRSTAAATRSSARSATASRSTRPSSRTGTTRSAARCASRPRRIAVARGAARATRQRPVGRHVHASTVRGAGSSPSPPGPTASRPGRTSCAARSEAGQEDLAGELSEGAVLLGRSVPTVDEALAADGGDRTARSPRRRSRSTSIASSRASAPGTSSSRAPGAASAVSPRCCRELAQLGFDVVYLPPVHPIGHTNRKGRNNAVSGRAGRRRLAVGDRLGARAATTRSIPISGRGPTSTRWSRLRAQAGVELALDFAIQCSPDHPWLKEHPEWFNRRPTAR